MKAKEIGGGKINDFHSFTFKINRKIFFKSVR